MGPLAGTMVCDYYLIKKGRLNIDELYADRGIYWYSRGWNWRAFASFAMGFAPLLPGFAKSIDPALDVGGAWKIYTFAWIFGFFLSLLVHFVICTYISVPKASIVEEAVYPPRTEEELMVLEGEGEDASVQETYLMKEKDTRNVV